MRRGNLRRNRNGGALLDLVIGTGLVLLGAFALASVGITFPELLRGASRFFGLG